jgi:hypothetical protein
MPRKTHPAVLVIAICHFVFGALGLCGSAFGAVQLSGLVPPLSGFPQGGAAGGAGAKAQQFQQRLQEALEKAPGQQTLQTVNLGLSFLLSAVLVAAGIGLLQMRRWARRLSIAYGIVGLVNVAAATAFYFAVTQPALDAAWPDLERIDPNMARFMQMIFSVSGAIAPCFGVLYPAAVLIVMLWPSVGKAFNAPPREADGEGEDQPDYYDDRYER